MMKRTQLYLEEKSHYLLVLWAKSRGWSLSQTIRKALEEFTEKPEIKKFARKAIKSGVPKIPFADMAGIISSGDPNLSKNIDEIYDED